MKDKESEEGAERREPPRVTADVDAAIKAVFEKCPDLAAADVHYIERSIVLLEEFDEETEIRAVAIDCGSRKPALHGKVLEKEIERVVTGGSFQKKAAAEKEIKKKSPAE